MIQPAKFKEGDGFIITPTFYGLRHIVFSEQQADAVMAALVDMHARGVTYGQDKLQRELRGLLGLERFEQAAT